MNSTLLELAAKTNNFGGACTLRKHVTVLSTDEGQTNAMVASQSSDTVYEVRINTIKRTAHCTCPQAKHKRALCKHIGALALHLVHEADKYDVHQMVESNHCNTERLVMLKTCPKKWQTHRAIVSSSTLKSLHLRLADGTMDWFPKSQIGVLNIQGQNISFCAPAWLMQTKQNKQAA